jgi:hypothetical protein
VTNDVNEPGDHSSIERRAALRTFLLVFVLIMLGLGAIAVLAIRENGWGVAVAGIGLLVTTPFLLPAFRRFAEAYRRDEP